MKRLVIAVLALWLLQGMAWAASSKPPSGAQKQKQAYSKTSAVKKAKARPKALHKVHAKRARTHPVRMVQNVDDDGAEPLLKSTAAFVLDPSDGRALYAKNIKALQPIASITKVMTAMVVLDAKLDLQEQVTISEDDVDALKHTRSRLPVGSVLTRDDLLRLALMASENRAAAALSRAYPGGTAAFVQAMNHKAAALGMERTRFVDGTGLSSENVSTAEELAKMVTAAYRYPVIQQYTTLTDHSVALNSGRVLAYHNSNGLIKDVHWQIDVSKTGYISEAGRCLVMQARIAAKPIVIVLLDSWGRYTRIADANRVKKWLESQLARQAAG
ncbi:MAG: D-alanyl-D-alanine endopeptidase [Burkholderiales bacterium]